MRVIKLEGVKVVDALCVASCIAGSTTAACPFAGWCHWEESVSIIITSFFQVFLHVNKIHPPFFPYPCIVFSRGNSSSSSDFPFRSHPLVPWSCFVMVHLHWVTLVCSCLVNWGASNRIPLQMSWQCWAEGKDYLPWPAGNTFSNTAQATLFAQRVHCSCSTCPPGPWGPHLQRWLPAVWPLAHSSA